MSRLVNIVLPGMWLACYLTPVVNPVQAQPVRYVDGDATGPVHDGLSWCSAFLHLQDALAGAAADSSITEIRVAQGVYRPDQGVGQSPGDQSATFQLLNGLALRGGYAGCGADAPDEHDPTDYVTILSGDLAGNDVGDLGDPSRNENSLHVVTASGTDATAVLAGFAITAGRAIGALAVGSGGGMLCLTGYASLSNCKFSGNSAEWWGGGLFCSRSAPSLTACLFENNQARFGGGMFNNYSSSPLLSHCTFLGNSAVSGGALYNDNASPVLDASSFTANTAQYGGGAMFNWWMSLPKMTNCTFTGNTADEGGGAIFNFNFSRPILTNCTFVENLAPAGRAVACDSTNQVNPNRPTITGCIFWDGGDEIWNNDGSTIIVNHTCVQDENPNDAAIFPGVGNIDDDPRLDETLHLAPGSPCINAGDNEAPLLPDTDFAGETRVQRCRVDLGAYESPYFLFDCNSNNEPDACDVVSGVSQDCNANGFPDECQEMSSGDFDRNGTVDLGDFAFWAECMNGPDSTSTPVWPMCANACLGTFDVDRDGDIDLRDHRTFQHVFLSTCEGGVACDDGLFCNGFELCVDAVCVSGSRSIYDDLIYCTIDVCSETDDAVMHVPDDALCDDGQFCNGSETCGDDGCQPGTYPCGEGECDEEVDRCYASDATSEPPLVSLDQDGNGVLDPTDLCPDTAAGNAAETNGNPAGYWKASLLSSALARRSWGSAPAE